MRVADSQVKSFTHESEPGHCLFISPSCIVLKLNILFRDACRNSIPATLLLSQLYSSPWDRLLSSSHSFCLGIHCLRETTRLGIWLRKVLALQLQGPAFGFPEPMCKAGGKLSMAAHTFNQRQRRAVI